MKKVAKDMPLSHITLRKYEKPRNLPKRELVKKVCLSLGLLQPGDSRDVIVDILEVLLRHRKGLHIKRIEDLVIKNRKRHKLELFGIAQSNITRQLRRLRESFLVEKHLDAYRITEKASLVEIYDEKIIRYHLDSIVSRVREYLSLLESNKKP